MSTNGLLTAKVAGSVENVTRHNKKHTLHLAGEEGQQAVAMSTSTHTQLDSLQRTCRADSLLHV